MITPTAVPSINSSLSKIQFNRKVETYGTSKDGGKRCTLSKEKVRNNLL